MAKKGSNWFTHGKHSENYFTFLDAIVLSDMLDTANTCIDDLTSVANCISTKYDTVDFLDVFTRKYCEA